jgi:hypothetical protein
MLYTDVNIGIFLHQNDEEETLHLDPEYWIYSYGLGFESR